MTVRTVGRAWVDRDLELITVQHFIRIDLTTIYEVFDAHALIKLCNLAPSLSLFVRLCIQATA